MHDIFNNVESCQDKTEHQNEGELVLNDQYEVVVIVAGVGMPLEGQAKVLNQFWVDCLLSYFHYSHVDCILDGKESLSSITLTKNSNINLIH